MRSSLFIFCLLPSLAMAMDDDMVFSYTRAELAAGEVHGRSGALQSVALDGWIGGDRDRLWWQGDAEWRGGSAEGNGFGAWYGHYFAPFWDAQLGVRSEGGAGSANYLSMGVRGLAPYQYDSDIKLELRSDGKWFLHAGFDQEVLLSNRFILRPWLDGAYAAEDVDATVRRGIYLVEAGIQARYEFSRRFAPFVQISRAFHPRARPDGEPHATRLLGGLRLIF